MELDKKTCYQIANNVAKRYEVIDKYWNQDFESCTITIRLPNNMEATFSFDVIDNVLSSTMEIKVPFDEKLELSYYSKDHNIYGTYIYLRRESGNLVYRFSISERIGELKDLDTLIQGKFIDEMLKKLSIEYL
jgi:hypothetical protein